MKRRVRDKAGKFERKSRWRFSPAGLIVVLAVFFSPFFSSLPAYAAPAYVYDYYGLLEEEEERSLDKACRSFGEETGMKALIVTVGRTEVAGDSDADTESYMEDFGERTLGRNVDYIGLVINMDTRYVYIDVTGSRAQELYGAETREDILDAVTEDLASGLYRDAGQAFLDRALYRVRHDPAKWRWLWNLAIAAGGAGLISLVIYWVRASAHREIHIAANADRYMAAGSFQLTQNSDLLERRYVTSIAKPVDDNRGGGGGGSHFSSSGQSHSGSGRHF